MIRNIIYDYLDEYVRLMKRRWYEPENYYTLTRRLFFLKKSLNYLMNVMYHDNKKICKKYDFIKKIDFRNDYHHVELRVKKNILNSCLLWSAAISNFYNILDLILEGVYDDCSDDFDGEKLFDIKLYKEYDFFKYEGLFE